MSLLTFSTEVIGTLELDDLRETSLEAYPKLSQGYHYGASESNVTYPKGELERIDLKARRGRYSGIGTATKALDQSTLLTEKRLKAQTKIVQEMIESLEENGKGTYKIMQVVTLFNPIKLFVLLSNGKEEEDILYMSINSWSNGSGQRKELNWPDGVPFESKRTRRGYIEKQVKAAQKKVDAIKKDIEQIESGKRQENYEGHLKSLKNWHLDAAIENLKFYEERLAAF